MSLRVNNLILRYAVSHCNALKLLINSLNASVFMLVLLKMVRCLDLIASSQKHWRLRIRIKRRGSMRMVMRSG